MILSSILRSAFPNLAFMSPRKITSVLGGALASVDCRSIVYEVHWSLVVGTRNTQHHRRDSTQGKHQGFPCAFQLGWRAGIGRLAGREKSYPETIGPS